MMIKPFDFMALPWDTDYFGVKSAKVIINKDIETLEIFTKISRLTEEYDFITIQNINNENNNNYWIGTRLNAQLVDINLQYKKKLLRNKHITTKSNLIETTNEYGPDNDIVKIAENSFAKSRFFNDKNLDINKSKKIYVEWVINSFEKKGKYFTRFKKDEKTYGFILFTLNYEQSFAVIELIAIDEGFTGQNIGTELHKQLEKYLINIGISTLRVGTQINNIGANNFYTSLGYKLTTCSSIYHYWPNI